MPLAIQAAQLPWLLCGALGGYLLVMFSNPARSSFRDGLRVVRRYPAMWLLLGICGFCYALFELAQRAFLHSVLPPEGRPAFTWLREAWRDPDLWLTGSPESVWYLPPHALPAIARESAPAALDTVAGIFNNVVTTFPVAVLAAVLLMVNWHGHHGVMVRALRWRFGTRGLLVYLGVMLCALAEIARPFIYALPALIDLGPRAALMWVQWSRVVIWLAFLFEYLCGVCLQIYLILLAYCWVRGIHFTTQHLIDFAIRRWSFVMKWAALVMAASTLFLDLPLILKNFPAFQSWFPDEPEVVDARLKLARSVLVSLLLIFSTMQITLTFHSESLGRALRDHWRFLARHGWAFAWFLIVAAIHCWFFQVLNLTLRTALGEGTAIGITWSLLSPWLGALVAAWLLASWVCLFKQCDTGRHSHENWIQF